MTLLVGSIFHVTRKIVSEMTYNVSMGTLNPTILYYTLSAASCKAGVYARCRLKTIETEMRPAPSAVGREAY